jgi:dihydrolipoamide dehydrogenase
MADATYDVTYIGAGPGGYVSAIRAAQLGLKVAIIEIRPTLGGTCLNVGCIPSKALLHSSHLYEEAKEGMAAHGVIASNVTLDLKLMMGHKNSVVDDTIKGVDYLMKKNKIERLIGTGSISAPGSVTVTDNKGKSNTITTKNIVIATGSEVSPLPGVEIDERLIVSSTGALTLKKVPKKMIVIGAGVIGLELGSVWRRLGAEVEVIEFLDVCLSGSDAEVSKIAQRSLKKQGLKFKMKSKVVGATTSKSGVVLKVEPRDGGDIEEIKADCVLVAIGRRPYTKGLGLEKIGVEMDRGFIKTTDGFKTNISGIYAIGDVIGGMMLAHKAEDEGVVLAEMLAGQSGHINYDAVPGIVYTWPEVATVGKTEEQLKEAGVAYNVGKFNFTANARARAISATDGFVKILADTGTDEVLGVHIVGAAAGELIQECIVAMEFGGSAEDIARTCHGHPGLSEVVKEAALDVDNRALHS